MPKLATLAEFFFSTISFVSGTEVKPGFWACERIGVGRVEGTRRDGRGTDGNPPSPSLRRDGLYMTYGTYMLAISPRCLIER